MNRMTITPGQSDSARADQDTFDQVGNASGYVHPDLQDLSFGGLGNEQSSLPPPMQPVLRNDTSTEPVWDQHRGSLSDFSDYESEEDPQPAGTHLAGPSSGGQSGGRVADIEDPFADPFAD